MYEISISTWINDILVDLEYTCPPVLLKPLKKLKTFTLGLSVEF